MVRRALVRVSGGISGGARVSHTKPPGLRTVARWRRRPHAVTRIRIAKTGFVALAYGQSEPCKYRKPSGVPVLACIAGSTSVVYCTACLRRRGRGAVLHIDATLPDAS